MVDNVYNGTMEPGVLYPSCVQCMHGAECMRLIGSYIQCLCTDGYEGDRCQYTEIRFTEDQNKTDLSGLATGLIVGACLIILITLVAFFMWRKRLNKAKEHEKEVQQTNRMKKMSIEGLSIIGEKPAVKRTAIPVCIAIEEENAGLNHLKISMEEENSYSNPLNPHMEERRQRMNGIALV